MPCSVWKSVFLQVRRSRDSNPRPSDYKSDALSIPPSGNGQTNMLACQLPSNRRYRGSCLVYALVAAAFVFYMGHQQAPTVLNRSKKEDNFNTLLTNQKIIFWQFWDPWMAKKAKKWLDLDVRPKYPSFFQFFLSVLLYLLSCDCWRTVACSDRWKKNYFPSNEVFAMDTGLPRMFASFI